MTAVNTEHEGGAINIISDPKKGIVSGTADINASPERVFRALTTEEQASGGDRGCVPHARLRDRSASGWQVGLQSARRGRSPMSVGGEYITVDPPRLLEYTWKPSWTTSLRVACGSRSRRWAGARG
jgi:uncharacterized protein YndB with AHSA1/START domain